MFCQVFRVGSSGAQIWTGSWAKDEIEKVVLSQLQWLFLFSLLLYLLIKLFRALPKLLGHQEVSCLSRDISSVWRLDILVAHAGLIHIQVAGATQRGNTVVFALIWDVQLRLHRLPFCAILILTLHPHHVNRSGRIALSLRRRFRRHRARSRRPRLLLAHWFSSHLLF